MPRRKSTNEIVSNLLRVGGIPPAKRAALREWWLVTRLLVPPVYRQKLFKDPNAWAVRLHELAARARPIWNEFREDDIQDALAADIVNEMNTDLIAHSGDKVDVARSEVQKFILDFERMIKRLDEHANALKYLVKGIPVIPNIKTVSTSHAAKRIVDFWQLELHRDPKDAKLVDFADAVFEALETPYARSTLKRKLSAQIRIPKSQ